MIQENLQKIYLPGLVRALSPMIHGEPLDDGQRRPNHTAFRRIPYVLGKGQVVSMPVVSGNAIRGKTRRRFIDRTLAVLEAYNLLDPYVAYFLLAGGTTERGSATIGGPELRKEIRENLPFVDLLGGTLRGCFMESKMRVDFMVPVVKETLAIEPIASYGNFDHEALPSFADLTSRAHYNPLRLTRYDEGIFKPDEEETPAAEEDGQSGEKKRSNASMIYTGEVMPANTVFTHSFRLDYSPPATVNAFWAFVQCFVDSEEVGGWHSKGCSRVETVYYDPETKEKITDFDDKARPYWEYLEANKAKLRDYLVDLGEKTAALAKEAKEKKRTAAANGENGGRGRGRRR